MLIDPETGFTTKGDSDAPPGVPASLAATRPQESTASAVQKALAGLLPRGRALRADEVRTLGPVHIQMIFDKACGLRNMEIAERYEMSEPHVSKIMNHPDAEYLLAVIMSQMADELTDPVRRIKSYANEALNVKVEILRTSKNDVLRNRVASDFLDRAGYGAPQKIEIDKRETLTLDNELKEKLSGALDAAKRVAVKDYTKFLVRSGGGAATGETPSGESITSESQTPTLLSASTPDSSASPGESPSDNSEERAA